MIDVTGLLEVSYNEALHDARRGEYVRHGDEQRDLVAHQLVAHQLVAHHRTSKGARPENANSMRRISNVGALEAEAFVELVQLATIVSNVAKQMYKSIEDRTKID